MAGAQTLSPEERQKRIEEAKRKAEEIKRQREASTGQPPPAPAPADPSVPPPPSQPLSPEERQRRIDEAVKRAEEAKKARAAGASPAIAPAPRPAQPTAGPPKSVKTFNLALREWAVVVRAMEEGKQMILFLKGGVGDRDLRVLRDEFILVPAQEGQEEAFLKPAFRPMLKEVASNLGREDGRSATSFARLFDVIPVKNLDKLAQLDEYHIFSKPYIDAKHNSRVDRPTNVLFLRVYKLANPVEFQAGAQHGNWLEAKAQVPLDGAQPALEEGKFRALYKEIRTIIS